MDKRKFEASFEENLTKQKFAIQTEHGPMYAAAMKTPVAFCFHFTRYE